MKVDVMLTCGEYDYIEIVCMYKYPIQIIMKSGDVIKGKALDTQLNAERNECIKVAINNTEETVILSDINTLAVTIENPHFNMVSFG